MIHRYKRRFPHAMRGITDALKHDFGFRSQIYLGVTIAFIVGVFFTPISSLELLLIILAYTLVLITELQNSAAETALNLVHPEYHEEVRKTKDMAAGAVLLAGLFLLLALGLIYFIGL